MSTGWIGSNRKVTLPAGWPRIRARVLRRDGYRCVMESSDGTRCKRRATDCDHIDDPLDHSEDNLRALCGYHHQLRSSSQGGKAAAAERQARREAVLSPEEHPSIASAGTRPSWAQGIEVNVPSDDKEGSNGRTDIRTSAQA